MNTVVQLEAGIAELDMRLSDEAEQKLHAYIELLDKWNRVYNLTAVRDVERMVSHHLLDSLAIVPVFDEILAARPHSGVAANNLPSPCGRGAGGEGKVVEGYPHLNPDGTTSHSTKPASGQVAGYLPLTGEGVNVGLRSATAPHPNPLPEGEGANARPTAIDVGSGGGLPGIPLAIARPDLQVTLIDSVAKKTAFLLQAKAELGLENVSVVTGRVETHQDAAGFDTIISRAFSDLKEFVSLTRHLLAPGGRWLAMKGLYPHEEIAALPDWVRVSANPVLNIPQLDATRHLIILEPVP